MNQNIDLKLTLEAWAEFVVEKWLVKMQTMRIGSSYQLADSFVHQVIMDAGGNPQKIDFMFNYYGKFVDMGVGKGRKLDSAKVITTINSRRSKPWYSKTFASQVTVLNRILAEKYAYKGMLTVIENIGDNALRDMNHHI